MILRPLTLRLTLLGASGKMGQEVLRCLAEFPSYVLHAALVSPNSGKLAQVCMTAQTSSGAALDFSCGIAEALDGCDVLMDFSSPTASLQAAALCAKKGIPALIGTTGFSAEQERELRAHGKSCALLLAPNTSIGIVAMCEALCAAHKILGERFEIEISETHHRHKRDAPSGTALSLARMLSESDNELQIVLRAQNPARAGAKEIGISSLRGGDVAGEHTVHFLGPSERLEITHRVKDRSVFARGALVLCARLAGLRPRVYAVKDLCGERAA